MEEPMRITAIAGLAAATMLAAAAGATPAGALPIEPSAISKADIAANNVVDVQWRRHWRGRYYGYGGPRYYGYGPGYYGYGGPRYSYGYPYYRRYYYPGPSFSIGPRGFGFRLW
jgi:hypothetical protein